MRKGKNKNIAWMNIWPCLLATLLWWWAKIISRREEWLSRQEVFSLDKWERMRVWRWVLFMLLLVRGTYLLPRTIRYIRRSTNTIRKFILRVLLVSVMLLYFFIVLAFVKFRGGCCFNFLCDRYMECWFWGYLTQRTLIMWNGLWMYVLESLIVAIFTVVLDVLIDLVIKKIKRRDGKKD